MVRRAGMIRVGKAADVSPSLPAQVERKRGSPDWRCFKSDRLIERAGVVVLTRRSLIRPSCHSSRVERRSLLVSSHIIPALSAAPAGSYDSYPFIRLGRIILQIARAFEHVRRIVIALPAKEGGSESALRAAIGTDHVLYPICSCGAPCWP